jgi:hypothetical protein
MVDGFIAINYLFKNFLAISIALSAVQIFPTPAGILSAVVNDFL